MEELRGEDEVQILSMLVAWGDVESTLTTALNGDIYKPVQSYLSLTSLEGSLHTPQNLPGNIFDSKLVTLIHSLPDTCKIK